MTTSEDNQILYFHVETPNAEYTIELNASDSTVRVSDGEYVWANTDIIADKQLRQRVTVGLKKRAVTIIPSTDSSSTDIRLVSSFTTVNFILNRVHETTMSLQQLFCRMSKRLSTTSEDLDKFICAEPVQVDNLYSNRAKAAAKIRKLPTNRSAINPHARKRKAPTGVTFEED